MHTIDTKRSRGANQGSRGAGPASETLGVRLRYAFETREQHGATLDNPLVELLAAVAEAGSIRHAAARLGLSYRHVWGRLRDWERALGQPLMSWSQGQRARPTAFALRLLRAERDARIRMQAHIESLRSDLARTMVDARDERNQVLTICASHDLALPVLRQHLIDATDLRLDITFQGSVDALRALNDGQCAVAGFHVPVACETAPTFSRALKPLLKRKAHRLLACSRRLQGLMMRKEHAPSCGAFKDLARSALRFVNRQPGSGTRMLIDHLLQSESIDPEKVVGYGRNIEHTHVAVALCIASGVGDVGVGVEAAALQYGLHFVPLVQENYFLACCALMVEQPALQLLRAALAGPRWAAILAGLPGYEPAGAAGETMGVDIALPWWRPAKETADPA